MADTPTPPGEILKAKLRQRGWTYEDLAYITGRSLKSIGDLARGVSGVTPDFAAALAAAFQDQAQDWLQYDSIYKLSLVTTDVSSIESRSKLLTRAPIRDMQKRGWIKQSEDPSELWSELTLFEEGGMSSVSARRSEPLRGLNPAENAWCYRARSLGSTLIVKPFSVGRAKKVIGTLKRVASHPKEMGHIAEVLSDCGVRFVIVEPLPGAKIDGATFWIDSGPVIALSMRYDRIDWFWFTLMHEWSHVINQDPISVDVEMVRDDELITLTDSAIEDRANREAVSSLIPTAEMESFIRRVGPLYSKVRVIQFANRMKIHPGIITGQLQRRGELGYSGLRDFLVKVRDVVVSTTLTDGWGQLVSPTTTKKGII